MYNAGWACKLLHIEIKNRFQRSEKKNERKREDTREEKGKEIVRLVFQWSILVDTSQKWKQVHIQYSCPSGSCKTQKRLFMKITVR